jgi:hypothetical protein
MHRFDAFVFIFMRNLYHNGSTTQQLRYKLIENIIQNIFVYFGDFAS